MSALAEQHERWTQARVGLGFVPQRGRVRRDLLVYNLPQRPVIASEPPEAPPEPKPLVLAPEGEQWPFQPPAVFYDEAARPPRMTSLSIIADVCNEYHVSRRDLLSVKRYENIVRARDEAAYRMTAYLDMSLTAIGRRLNRDHTSIIASLRRHAKANPIVAATLRTVNADRKRRRAALKEQAVQMFLAGRTIKDIMEALPLSRSSIQTSVRTARLYIVGQEVRPATGVNEPLRAQANTGVSEHGEAA
jgi:hypothetical protein